MKLVKESPAETGKKSHWISWTDWRNVETTVRSWQDGVSTNQTVPNNCWV